MKDISTPDFSTPSFNPGPFNPRLFNHELVNPGLINHEFLNHGVEKFMHCNPVQGQYRARTGFSLCSKFSQGKTCFHYREPLFSLQGPCIYYREFPVRITTQGNPCSHYREWVCSAAYFTRELSFISQLACSISQKLVKSAK